MYTAEWDEFFATAFADKSLVKSSLPTGEMPVSLKNITFKNPFKNSHAIGLF